MNSVSNIVFVLAGIYCLLGSRLDYRLAPCIFISKQPTHSQATHFPSPQAFPVSQSSTQNKISTIRYSKHVGAQQLDHASLQLQMVPGSGYEDDATAGTDHVRPMVGLWRQPALSFVYGLAVFFAGEHAYTHAHAHTRTRAHAHTRARHTRTCAHARTHTSGAFSFYYHACAGCSYAQTHRLTHSHTHTLRERERECAR